MSAHQSVNPEDALLDASVDASGRGEKRHNDSRILEQSGSGVTGNTRWGSGIFTAIGSLPGTDPVAAASTVFDDLPDLPYLPELPARGPWASMIGRAAGLLVDMPMEMTSVGWQLARRPGVDVRRAKDFLERDLDALALAGDGYTGFLKVQVVGPWTLSSTVELRHVDRVLGDLSATRDLAQSLAEGISRHLTDIYQRFPNAMIVVQLDEPATAGVLAGAIPTRSGLSNLSAIDEQVVTDYLRIPLEVCPISIVHCCAADIPIGVLHRAGANAISLDATKVSERSYEDIGVVVESGVTLLLGLVSSTPTPIEARPEIIAKPALELWHRLGFRAEDLTNHVVTPTCGFAQACTDYPAKAIRTMRQVARFLAEFPE